MKIKKYIVANQYDFDSKINSIGTKNVKHGSKDITSSYKYMDSETSIETFLQMKFLKTEKFDIKMPHSI